MRTYEEIVATKPKISSEAFNLNTEGALLKLCEAVPTELLKTIPDLNEWFEFKQWWLGLTVEERKAVLRVEWKYD